MQLISYLQEAADIPIASLRAAMKKDKRVNQIFSKGLRLEEIQDVKEFVDTLKFYLFNNRHVLEFAKQAGGRKFSEFYFNARRKTKAEDMTQDYLNDIQELVTSLFKDHTSAQNASISAATMKQMYEFVNRVGRAGLTRYAQKEFLSTPGIRPDKSITVYRGLNFSQHSLKERETYDGSVDVGDGLKFLRAIREGKRVADLKWDDITLWTHSKEEALRQAYDTTFYDKSSKIRTDSIGFIISTLARPEDIVVDVRLLPKLEQWESNPVILKAGKYLARVVHKFTAEGEVDPTEKPDDFSDAAGMADALEMFALIFKPPFEEPTFSDSRLHLDSDEQIELFKKLAEPEAKEKITKSMNTLLDFFKTYIEPFNPKQFAGLAGTKFEKEGQVAEHIYTWMMGRVSHPTELNPNYSRPRALSVPRHTLTGEQHVNTKTYMLFADTLRAMAADERFRDWQTGGKINDLARLGGGAPTVKDLHRLSKVEQKKQVDVAIGNFYDIMGEPKPTDRKEQIARMATILKRIFTNADILRHMWDIRSELDKLVP